MAASDTTDTQTPFAGPLPSLEQMQHWTRIIGQAQQMMIEHGTRVAVQAEAGHAPPLPVLDPERWTQVQTAFAADGMALWQRFLDSRILSSVQADPAVAERPDRRFADPQWRDNPIFDLIRQSYLLVSDYLLKLVDTVEGLDTRQQDKLRFATRSLVDALSPSNFPLTNPQVIERAIETGGESLLKGLSHLLADMEKGQLSQADGTAFEVGRNIAATPGQVVWETPLYQLIQYEPVTKQVGATPLLIFPPWINRFYILDLSPEKSFVRWAVEQGLTVFMVSWKSADASMNGIEWDDYVLNGQIDAIDAVREILDVEAVHAIGYCVAGTTLAASLAVLEARGEAAKVASATFFTAQVDFSDAGELSLFVDDDQLNLIEALSADGYLDGRFMAATFNLLRGRELIWNYVVNNYLLGQDYPPFDLLFWNGDTTNLPAAWHKSYLTDLYRDNKLAQPGALHIAGVPLDLRTVKTPSYVQAGREDHIAPATSVWKITEHFAGPIRFVLAGSGHIAGVVNPPAAQKYQYWTNKDQCDSLAAFIAGARESKGSWWPDWIKWIESQDDRRVPAKGARKPGKGRVKAIEPAPGRYVRMR